MQNQKTSEFPYIHYLYIILVIDALLLLLEQAILPILAPVTVENLRLWLLRELFRYPTWLAIVPNGPLYAIVFFILVVAFSTAHSFSVKYGMLWLFLLHAMIMLIYDVSIFTAMIHFLELSLISLNIYAVVKKNSG